MLGAFFLISGIPLWLIFAVGIGFKEAVEISFPTVWIAMGINYIIMEVKVRKESRNQQ
jgi:hypothetical protein